MTSLNPILVENLEKGLLRVEDLMAKNKDLPVVSRDMTLSDTLIEISSKGLGVALVVEKKV